MTEQERKKKITEVKTFPVPFALKEIKENICISTSTPAKPSKEQIIKQACDFHSQGNISESTKYYQFIDFYELNKNNPRKNFNYIT